MDLPLPRLTWPPPPCDETKLAVQRSTQMRFQIKLGAKGWRLIGFKPSDFFTQ